MENPYINQGPITEELVARITALPVAPKDLPEGIQPETASQLPEQEKSPEVPVEYQLQELYRRVRELEENLQRLTNHINREIGVAKDIPLRMEYDGYFARIKELTKLIN